MPTVLESGCLPATGAKSANADVTVQRTVTHLMIAYLMFAHFVIALLSFFLSDIPNEVCY
ncbi:MAG: hypothetical protein LBK82_08335 [Planctomycetaceae bacterium]|nr:hypothetical protein [Planctomycetaceae bacterium]